MHTLSFQTPASQKQDLLETDIERHNLKDSFLQLRNPRPGVNKMKRFIDICLSASLLLLLVPTLFPVIALLIMLDSAGSPVYVQKRTGKDKKVFSCFKFRTMLRDESLAIEQRITRFGMFLRKTHLDELPQLLNVLLGTMSLVGPRPHMLADTAKFESMAKDYHLRHVVHPGITGLAQVNGYFGEVEDREHLQKRVELDLNYIHTLSLKKDLHILSKTLFIPLKKGV